MLVDENPYFWQKRSGSGVGQRAVGLELLSFKMRDFHRVPEEGEEYNRVWLRKCGQYFLVPKERTLYSHVEADESAPDTRPAS